MFQTVNRHGEYNWTRSNAPADAWCRATAAEMLANGYDAGAIIQKLTAYGCGFHAAQALARGEGNSQTPGRIAYEADLAIEPLYNDGAPRRTWDQLDAIARWSWERNPTVRAKATCP